MSVFLSIGEAMVELSRSADDASSWRLGFAGDTLNTAWYARACLGPDWQVEYLTRLGRDPFSPQMSEFLAAHDIGGRFIRYDGARSVGLYAIETHEGERSFTYWRESSAARLLASDPALLDEAFAAADVVFLSGVTLAILPEAGREALITRLVAARNAGKVTAFDPNLRPKLWENAETMRLWLTRAASGAAILLPGFEDEAEWFGDASAEACARRWQAAGASECVVKNGGAGVTILDGSGLREIAVTRETVVDSTGAGDSFNGGYLAARLNGSGPDAAVLQGHRVAAKVVTQRGALVHLQGW